MDKFGQVLINRAGACIPIEYSGYWRVSVIEDYGNERISDGDHKTFLGGI
jgi:hypothetical protein